MVKKIEALIISHGHYDHFGGLLGFLEKYRKVLPANLMLYAGGEHNFCQRWSRTPVQGEFNDFGAIGSALPAAIGIAAARGDGKVLLVEGDGSLMMHVQELETIRRQGIKMLMAIMNDGGYGAEVHKFRANGITTKEAVHGRGDLAAAATGFGLRGASVTQPGAMKPLFSEPLKLQRFSTTPMRSFGM